MSKSIDLTNKTFNRLTIISFAYKKNGKRYWNAVCDCGNRVIVRGDRLKNGHTKSCGCLVKERLMPNKYIIKNNICYIYLSQNKMCTIDAKDYNIVSQYKWYVCKYYTNYYAKANTGKDNGYKPIYMHQLLISKTRDKKYIDHIDGNGLNNCRKNLRICTNAENVRNSRIPKNNTSGYKGVSWDKQHQKYEAYIRVNNRKKSLGFFNSKKDAAKAYNRAALLYYKKFARCNIIKNK